MPPQSSRTDQVGEWLVVELPGPDAGTALLRVSVFPPVLLLLDGDANTAAAALAAAQTGGDAPQSCTPLIEAIRQGLAAEEPSPPVATRPRRLATGPAAAGSGTTTLEPCAGDKATPAAPVPLHADLSRAATGLEPLAEIVAALVTAPAETADPPQVFLRTPLEAVGEELLRLLLDHPRLTLVHVEECGPGSQEGADPVTSQRSAQAVATLAQAGFMVPVEVRSRSSDPAFWLDHGALWNVVNRGAGLILAPDPAVVDADQFADALLSVYEAAFLPANRLSPMSGFLASLGARESALPFPTLYFPWGDEQPAPRHCRWRDLAGHRCGTLRANCRDWECRLAECVYPRLLGSIRSDALAQAQGLTRRSGSRLFARIRQGKLVFAAEPAAEGEGLRTGRDEARTPQSGIENGEDGDEPGGR